jgi:hypothetical protein
MMMSNETLPIGLALGLLRGAIIRCNMVEKAGNIRRMREERALLQVAVADVSASIEAIQSSTRLTTRRLISAALSDITVANTTLEKLDLSLSASATALYIVPTNA